jgi:A/G-specific adenine glycosylase
MDDVNLARRLLAWYDCRRRELPWRTESDPYRIWVSEVMLQQTRVEAVIPYYHNFLRRFPDMRSLADASPEELLSAWQGLGYYSRARNLQQGVREVLARYGGTLPDSRDEISALPGIGPYTAGAILSIAYNRAEPAVDGNVLRVFSRLLHIEELVERTPVRRRIEAAVREMMAGIPRCGDITQALMELGALVCIPRNPRCGECPWQEVCIANQRSDQALLPRRKAAEAPRQVMVFTGILLEDGRALAVRRPDRGLLAGMWEFPSVEVLDPPTAAMGAAELLCARFRELGQEVSIQADWHSLTHSFSHRQWQMKTFRCRRRNPAGCDPAGEGRWLDHEQIATMNWAGPHRKIAVWVRSELEQEMREKGL